MSAVPVAEDRPTVQDVLRVKTLLQQTSTPVLPLEVIDIIIDFAEYWPHTSNTCQSRERDSYGGNHHASVKDRMSCRSLPLGCPPKGPHDGGLLQPNSNYSTQMPYPSPPQGLVPADLEAQRTALLAYWSSYTMPRVDHPARKIVFTIKSHDQGWGGEPGHRGTYQGSFTWFDVGLERLEIFPQDFIDLPLVGGLKLNDKIDGEDVNTVDKLYTLRTIQPSAVPGHINPEIYKLDHPFLPPATCLQRNLTATSQSKEHVITWSWDDNINPKSEQGRALEEVGRGAASSTGEFVRSLKVGDVVTVWARARFPGWKNVVEDVKIDVYWAV